MTEPESLSNEPSESEQEAEAVSPEKPLLIFKSTQTLPHETYQSMLKSVQEVAESFGYGGVLVDNRMEVQVAPAMSGLIATLEGQAIALQALADAVADIAVVIANEGEEAFDPEYLDGTPM